LLFVSLPESICRFYFIIMKDLIVFTENPFLTIDKAKYSIEKFVGDHVNKMKSADNPAFAQIILSTTEIHTSITNLLDKRDKDFVFTKSFTTEVNKKIEEFKTLVLEMESLVCVKFKKKSGTYQEFYPHNRTEYHRANKGNILILFDRIIKLTTQYESKLGSEWKTQFTQMYAVFAPMFEKQKKYKGALAQAKPNFEELRLKTCNQLYKNLLIILAEHFEHPEEALPYFDESIINWKCHVEKREKKKNEKQDKKQQKTSQNQ
jgi:hypothetical protein